jgi:hypothetical protein
MNMVTPLHKILKNWNHDKEMINQPAKSKFAIKQESEIETSPNLNYQAGWLFRLKSIPFKNNLFQYDPE